MFLLSVFAVTALTNLTGTVEKTEVRDKFFLLPTSHTFGVEKIEREYY
jgi:hypothetical protein